MILVLRRSAASATASSTRVLGVAAWVAFLKSGVDPVVVGLAMGLLTFAYPARARRPGAGHRPVPALPRAADARAGRSRRAAGLRPAISPNERLQQLYHPWTSYVIVPLFALANAGITISGSFLAPAYTSPVTLGILLAYVVGKPLGITGAAWLRDQAQPRPAAAAGRLGGGRWAAARSPASASPCRC